MVKHLMKRPKFGKAGDWYKCYKNDSKVKGKDEVLNITKIIKFI